MVVWAVQILVLCQIAQGFSLGKNYLSCIGVQLTYDDFSRVDLPAPLMPTMAAFS